MEKMKKVRFKTVEIERGDGVWKVEGKASPPGWESPFVGTVSTPTNLSSFYVVAELARLFGERSTTYFSYLPPKLREMLRTSTEEVIHTLYKDDKNRQVELRIVEKPQYSLRASLMFTDYSTRKERTSVPLNDLDLYKFKEFIKPDIRKTAVVDTDGEVLLFEKTEDGGVKVVNPYGEEIFLEPDERCVVAASLNTLLSEQVRYWEFVNNVRAEFLETALEEVLDKTDETALKRFLSECDTKRCRKLLELMKDPLWKEKLRELLHTKPRMVDPVIEFARREGLSERAEELALALEAGRGVWKRRVKAIRPLKIFKENYSPEEAAVSFWNDFSRELPQPRMRFGRYYMKESIQNPIPVLFLLSIFEPD
ncbi:hypothetical protein Theam_1735 (plasmid) [Thermovibrio ammonificans HB-1]|uniref:Uncharacterized protein n=1 Tax=Thermovibrio ammonificans (strain DSM 15698 / JCM 12110 / HB-1) TaxID=648996 RepID=E8T6X0_THEA1|nr:hypothetical protein [Thermovibrio ammonificans]ADU97691.1 hypothetical protein Theam_1735 [Thermovibrio ammonificans HB-1]